VDSIIYTCPSCGDLLEVVHDLAELAKTPADSWRHLFDGRWRSTNIPESSGVWGKYELVMPTLRRENLVTFGEGCTPLNRATKLQGQLDISELYIKQCGLTHTGSFKDLGMTVLVSMVKQMIADGRSIRAVACASTGDTSAALAAYAAAADIPAVVILPRGKISTAQLVQPLACGARVIAVDTDFDGCMEMVRKLTEGGSVYLANSMNSLRIEGQKTVAFEIAQQLGWRVPDWVVIPGGNLGNVSALYAGFRMLTELGLIESTPRICVAQAEAANPLYQSFLNGFDSFEPVVARDTQASAIRIGNPVSRDKAIRALMQSRGVVEQASEGELAEAAALADQGGFFTCPHTAVALAALAKLRRLGAISGRESVVVISTANGLKFADFKIDYHSAEIRGQSDLRNKPIEVANDYDAVQRAVLGG